MLTAAGESALEEERHRRASRIARAIGDDLTDEEREIASRLPEILRKHAEIRFSHYSRSAPPAYAPRIASKDSFIATKTSAEPASR